MKKLGGKNMKRCTKMLFLMVALTMLLALPANADTPPVNDDVGCECGISSVASGTGLLALALLGVLVLSRRKE
jgi:MYXO-CTERM domain-containing protein